GAEGRAEVVLEDVALLLDLALQCRVVRVPGREVVEDAPLKEVVDLLLVRVTDRRAPAGACASQARRCASLLYETLVRGLRVRVVGLGLLEGGCGLRSALAVRLTSPLRAGVLPRVLVRRRLGGRERAALRRHVGVRGPGSGLGVRVVLGREA